MSEALPGTRPFGRNETSWNNTFADQYPKQWSMTLAWMQRALREAATIRDRERRHDQTWLWERRQLLRQMVGLDLFASEARAVRLQPTGSQDALYSIAMDNGLAYAGEIRAPDGPVRGVVVFGEAREDSSRTATEVYRQSGFCVICPFLTRETWSFRDDTADDRGRQWYAYHDRELLHFFAFIAGGALAGLEACELHATTAALLPTLGRDGRHPNLVVDMQGSWTLGAVVAAALHPGWADWLVLHEEADLLDHQEADERANTLWGFHRYFDALALLQLAEQTGVLFAETGPTPSAQAARAVAWFGDPAAVPGRRILRRDPEEAVAALQKDWARGEEGAGEETLAFPIPHARSAPRPAVTPEHLYLQAIRSKVAFLEAEHERSRARRERHYDLASLSPEAYRERIRAAVEAVMGPPLPRAADPGVRTRQISAAGPSRLYEVLMESVPGVDVAGYLLIPHGEGPYPAVICQHGLLGRPEELVGLRENWIYYRIARSLAEKGYATFVPFMTWGWGGTPARDRLAKHAYALGVTPNRFEAAQLQAVVDFLQSRPEVLADRIAFYGLSYGGHASVWLGAVEGRLAVVVTAGHFNDWHKKLTSTEISPPLTRPTAYITVEEGLDMFTFDVLNRLGHAEMATLNAPRPYLVENGLWDTVTPTAWVEAEFSRVRKVYEWLGAADKGVLTHFAGPHRIWGEESLFFLREHLRSRA